MLIGCETNESVGIELRKLETNRLADSVAVNVREASLDHICFVCFEELEDTFTTNCCSQLIHKNCLMHWTICSKGVKSNCPFCRAYIIGTFEESITYNEFKVFYEKHSKLLNTETQHNNYLSIVKGIYDVDPECEVFNQLIRTGHCLCVVVVTIIICIFVYIIGRK